MTEKLAVIKLYFDIFNNNISSLSDNNNNSCMIIDSKPLSALFYLKIYTKVIIHLSKLKDLIYYWKIEKLNDMDN